MNHSEIMHMDDFVSVIMPVYNEERYIAGCIRSLLEQDYPKERMEWIFVDGMSRDRTAEILKEYQTQYPDLITVLPNPDKTVPYAMNIGIEHAKGSYIVRLDAHAEYESDYISRCIQCLKDTGADNAGGIAVTKGRGFTGNCIAKMLSNKFGVGNSQFRTYGESGYVDTVPFGCFRREVFEKYGGYDVRLTRNQDNEMNYRIRKNGGKIYLSKDIRLTYYCRDTVPGLCDMAMKNGKWNVITMKLCPGSMGIRHFVPLALVLSVAALVLLSLLSPVFLVLLAAELAAYLILDAFFSAKSAESVKEFILLFVLFPVFHTAYGFGSIRGIFLLLKRRNQYAV